MTTRRHFLAALSALPFCGWLKPKVPATAIVNFLRLGQQQPPGYTGYVEREDGGLKWYLNGEWIGWMSSPFPKEPTP